MLNTDFSFRAGSAEEAPAPDLLDRDFLARSLSLSLRHQGENAAVVLAIVGKWGSGKSWVISKVRENLDVKTDPAIHGVGAKHPYLFEFRTWEWSGTDSLVTQLFDQLGAAVEFVAQEVALPKKPFLAGFHFRLKPREKLTHDKLNFYAIWLTTHGKIVDGYNKAIVGLSASLALCTTAGIFRESEWFSILCLALAAATGFASGALNLVGEVVAQNSSLAKAIKELEKRSPRELKADLKKQLAALKRPIVVVMDDLERLTAEEIASVFQLIKAQADFPNVYYLLAFDRDLVEGALEQIAPGLPGNGLPPGAGREFLEKIVPVIFDLPSIEPERLQSLLHHELEQTLGVSIGDNLRWSDLWQFGLSDFFQSVRDIERFINGMKFNAYLLGGDELDVDPLDLVAVETLRLFEPGTFHLLAKSRELLTQNFGLQELITRTGSDNNAATRWREGIKEALRPFYASAATPEGTRLLLRHLFPAIEKFLREGAENRAFSGESLRGFGGRVAQPEDFNRFFRYAIAPEDWSQAEVSEIFAKISSPSDFTAHMQDVADGKIKPHSSPSSDAKPTFQRSRFNLLALCDLIGQRIKAAPEAKSEVEIRRVVKWAAVLLDSGQILPTRSGDEWPDQEFERKIGRLAHMALLHIAEPVRRSSAALELIAEVAAYPALCALMIEEYSAQIKVRNNPELALYLCCLPEDRLSGAQQMVVTKLECALPEPEFWQRPLPRLYIEFWYLWGDEPSKARLFALLHSMLANEVGVLRLLEGYLVKPYSASPEDLGDVTLWRLFLEPSGGAVPLSRLVDLGEIRGVLPSLTRYLRRELAKETSVNPTLLLATQISAPLCRQLTCWYLARRFFIERDQNLEADEEDEGIQSPSQSDFDQSVRELIDSVAL